jgi:Tfp pilus assembly protein PilX
MNVHEIKQAVDSGKKVYWSNLGYQVIKDSIGQYLIKHICGHCIGLTWQDGTTLNGKEEEFFINE